MNEQQKNVVEVTEEANNNLWMVGIGMLVVGLVLGFIVGWYWQKNTYSTQDDDQAVMSTSTSATTTVTDAPMTDTNYQTTTDSTGSNSVSVDDQKAGSLVFIKHTDVSKPTWIAVREIINGNLGNILGAEMVTSPTDDLPVTLLRSTVTGQKYSVFLYQDDGDGQFDFKKDLLVMQDGSPVSAVFTAQ